MAEKKLKIRLPKNRANKDKYKIVGVNGIMMNIPYGEQVEIPESYYIMLMRSMDAEDQAGVFVEKVQSKSRKKSED